MKGDSLSSAPDGEEYTVWGIIAYRRVVRSSKNVFWEFRAEYMGWPSQFDEWHRVEHLGSCSLLWNGFLQRLPSDCIIPNLYGLEEDLYEIA